MTGVVIRTPRAGDARPVNIINDDRWSTYSADLLARFAIDSDASLRPRPCVERTERSTNPKLAHLSLFVQHWVLEYEFPQHRLSECLIHLTRVFRFQP
jgi:hypothetical protein